MIATSSRWYPSVAIGLYALSTSGYVRRSWRRGSHKSNFVLQMKLKTRSGQLDRENMTLYGCRLSTRRALTLVINSSTKRAACFHILARGIKQGTGVDVDPPRSAVSEN